MVTPIGKRGAPRKRAFGRAHYFGVSGQVVDISTSGARIAGLVPGLDVGDPIELRFSGPGGWLSQTVWGEVRRLGSWGFAARFAWASDEASSKSLVRHLTESERPTHPGQVCPPLNAGRRPRQTG